jgi:hypothetical protein
MSAIWKSHAEQLMTMINANNSVSAHLFMEQLMHLPVNIQDSIIEEISHLPICDNEKVAHIINTHSMIDLP